MRNVYVTGWGTCLPNMPIPNERIDEVLGEMPPRYSALQRRVLMNNGITSRHYAIDPDTGAFTHTNAELTAEAIRNLCRETGFELDDLECLACGTSCADQILPAHATMVHAELGSPPCETNSPSGVCCSGISALKYGAMSVASGGRRNAIVTGSELASPLLRASHFEPQMRPASDASDADPLLPFSNAFLRWMLSDGAGALLVEPRPNAHGLSLRIDWVDLLSFASESEVCMYLGLRKDAHGSLESYRTVSEEDRLRRDGFLSLAQDVEILRERLPVLTRKAFLRTIRTRELSADRIDWLLPHYSSRWFRKPLHDCLGELGFDVPLDRWFTNLETKGNTGAASIYVILEELMASGAVEPGQRILCMVPESSRMLFAFVHFTVV